MNNELGFSKVNRDSRLLLHHTRVKNKAAFLIGLLSMNNIIYLFCIGNTPILVAYVLSFFVLLFRSNDTIRVIREIPIALKAFFCLIILSFIQVLLFNAQYIGLWINGVGVFLIKSLYFFAVLTLSKYRYDMQKGILLGFVLNLAMCLFQAITYRTGNIFSFYSIFPSVTINDPRLLVELQTGGFFTEPGHLMRALGVSAIFLYPSNTKNRAIKVMYMISVILMMILAKSSSLLFFVAGLLFFILLRTRESIGKKVKFLLIILLIAIVFIATLNYIPTLYSGAFSFVKGILDVFNPNFSSTSVRQAGMAGARRIIQEYPMTGCGWNMCSVLMSKLGFYINNVRGSYSYSLTLIAELGMGALFFFWYVISTVISLSKKGRDYESTAYAASLLICLCIMSATDYAFEPSNMLLIGLATRKLIEVKGSQKSSVRIEA